MVVSLFFDGIYFPATAVLDLLDRLLSGYFDLVVIMPPPFTGLLQLFPLCGSSQSAAVPRDHPGSAQFDPAVSAAKAVFSQWELCAWTAEQALAHSATKLFLWIVEQPGAAQNSFSSNTEFQKLGRLHTLMPGEKIPQCINSPLWIRFLSHVFFTDILVALSPTLGFHSSVLGPGCAFPHTSPYASGFCTRSLFLARGEFFFHSPPRLTVKGTRSTPKGQGFRFSLCRQPQVVSGAISRVTRDASRLLARRHAQQLHPRQLSTTSATSSMYMGCTGAQRSSLLDLLGFLRRPGILLPLYFRCGSLVCPVSLFLCLVVSILTLEVVARGVSHRRASDAQKTQKCCVAGRGLKDGVSLPGEMGPLASRPPTRACATSSSSQASNSLALPGLMADGGGMATTSAVMATTTGTTAPMCSQAPLAPLEQRGSDDDGVPSLLPFSVGQPDRVGAGSVF